MSETFITADAKKIHYWDRTIGANTVLDEFTLPGEYPLASYVVGSGAVSLATATSHPLQIMAGSSLNVRIRRVRIEQAANATTAAIMTMAMMRLTTAGTGGTAITPAKFDPSDAAAGATAMSLPTAKGTEGTVLMEGTIVLRQAVASTGSQPDDGWEWTQLPGTKPYIIPAGTSNGIVFCRNVNAHAAATAIITVEFVETSF